jgi:Uma2 family endonuclease
MDAALKYDYFTYSDYLQWEGDERWELIDGEAYLMSPAPLEPHQKVSMVLSARLYHFLRGKTCQVYSAPFDVRLDPTGADDTVVQPDIVVICDRSKIDRRGCFGVPDMAVEILSPSTTARDRVQKYNLYRRFGVREYWIIDPDAKTLRVCLLRGGKYTTRDYGAGDSVPVSVLPGCVIELAEVFEDSLQMADDS